MSTRRRRRGGPSTCEAALGAAMNAVYTLHHGGGQVKRGVSYGQVFGMAMRRHRSVRGRTQQELADALGVTQSNYSFMESGRVVPTVVQIRRVAAALGVSPTDLMALAESARASLVKNGTPVHDVMPTPAPRRGEVQAAVLTAVARVKLSAKTRGPGSSASELGSLADRDKRATGGAAPDRPVRERSRRRGG